jgi:phosphopantothenoylcysteine decarboxylase/phosphopantothenate--cysteine ligase
VDVARRLIEEGAGVRVVMTEAASRFITPYTLEVITGSPVHRDLFSPPFGHLELPEKSDVFLIAPATANTISKLACGLADNLLSTIFLAHKGKVIIAPAMNPRMYDNGIIRKRIKELSKLGTLFVGPVTGSLACGDEGMGRMADVSDIVESVISSLTQKDLAGQKIVVTAGPTREHIDPVRFISNRSSGLMGFEVARAAIRRGAEITLISGPSHLKPPESAKYVSVESAYQMEKAVLKHFLASGALVMTAAVSDFMPSVSSRSKIRKTGMESVKLKKTPDILKRMGSRKGGRVLVGFAAETGSDIESAKLKLKKKNLDMIVLNDISAEGAGFESETNIVTVIDRAGQITDYPILKKIDVADLILDRMLPLMTGSR